MLRFVTALVCLTTPALAEITVSEARLVAAFPNAKAGALYLTLESDATDSLIGAYTPDAMAMLHETVEEDGVMRMSHVEEIDVLADEPLMMAPGGVHIMVMGLTAEMLEAPTFPLALIFSEAGEIAIEAEVRIGVERESDQGDGDHTDGKTE